MKWFMAGLLPLLALLIGCQHHVAMSQADREQITSIAVEPQVPLGRARLDDFRVYPRTHFVGYRYRYDRCPSFSYRRGFFHPRYYYPATTYAFADQKIKHRVEGGPFSLPNALVSAVEAGIAQSEAFSLADDSNSADAVLRLSVPTYGFTQTYRYFDDVRPLISLNAELLMNGRVVWSDSFRTGYGNYELSTDSFRRLLRKPDVLEASYSAAVDKLAVELVSSLENPDS